jgi:flagellar motor switch protein FliN/FliY
MSDTAASAPADEDWAAAMAEQAGTDTAVADPAPAARPAAGMFQEFGPGTASGHTNDIGMILDIPVQLSVELGRTRIPIKQILQLAQGSVVELDGLAGEPMNVLINGCLIAQGEVVVVNDRFGIRLTDIITPSERIRKLNR